MVEKSVELARRAGSPLGDASAPRAGWSSPTSSTRASTTRAAWSTSWCASFERCRRRRARQRRVPRRALLPRRVLLDCDSLDEAEARLRRHRSSAPSAVGQSHRVRAPSTSMLGLDRCSGAASTTRPSAWANIAPADRRSDREPGRRRAPRPRRSCSCARSAANATRRAAAELERLERGLLSSGDLGSGSDTIVEALLEYGEVRARAPRRRCARERAAADACARRKAALIARHGRARSRGPDRARAAPSARSARRWHARDGVRRCARVQGRAQLGLAEVARARGDQAAKTAHAQAAIALLRPLGLHHYAARAGAAPARPARGVLPERSTVSAPPRLAKGAVRGRPRRRLAASARAASGRATSSTGFIDKRAPADYRGTEPPASKDPPCPATPTTGSRRSTTPSSCSRSPTPTCTWPRRRSSRPGRCAREGGGIDAARIRKLHRGAPAPHPALPPEARLDPVREPPGLGRRRELQPRLPPAPHGAAAARQRGAAEAPVRAHHAAAPRPQPAALGDVDRRGSRGRSLRADLEDAPLHDRRRLGRRPACAC